jgi:hypothetical protein
MNTSKMVAIVILTSLTVGLGGFFLGRYIQPPREGATIWADEWDCTKAVETEAGADCYQWTKKVDE